MERRFLRWGLLSLVLVLVLTGCPDGAVGQSENARENVRVTDETLEVLLPTSTRGYSMEGILDAANPHYFEDVTVYLKYATGPFFTYAWTSAEIAAKTKLIPAAGTPALIFVAVDGEALANAQLADTTALNTAYDSVTVESQNIPVTLASTDANGNVTGTYGTSQTAMIYGDTTTTTVHPTLDNTRQAAVELSSAVARFELGTLKAADPTELTSITIDAVFVNKYYTTLAKDTTVDIDGLVWDATQPATSHWSKDLGDDSVVTSDTGTLCYAFQIFPDLVPHFIYEISGTLASGVRLGDGTTGSFTGKYVSITGFTELASTPPNAHTVYKVGLTNGGIPIDVDNITELPEIGPNALEVSITIAPWAEETITAEIF